MKVYFLTKYEDTAILEYQGKGGSRDNWYEGDEDPGEFEGLILLIFGYPFFSFEDAKTSAQQAIDEGFAILLKTDALISWQTNGSISDGEATINGPRGPMTVCFRIREWEVDDAVSHLFVVTDDEPNWDDKEACLNAGVPFSSIEKAKDAVYRELSITEKEANWTMPWLPHTKVDRPGVKDKTIYKWSLTPLAGGSPPTESHVANSPFFDEKAMAKFRSQRPS